MAPAEARNPASTGGHALSLRDISHFYGQTAAVQSVDLEVAAGSLVSLLGPSGCGKTTLLRIIAGFIEPTAGDLLVDGRSLRGVPANRRQMGIVFQNYALFPHMTIFENVAYGLRARREAGAAVDRRVGAMLELVQLSHLADRRPGQLSGGQQQRVALARALAVQPRLLLLDEPLSALDKNLRLDMQIEIKRIQREFGITTIMVTHDQQEAMSMSDRIAVLDGGRMQQFALPTEVYDRPSNMFVNQFIGTTNILPATVTNGDAGSCVVRLAGGSEIAVPAPAPAAPGACVLLSIRPEALRFAAPGEASVLSGRVAIALPLGPSIIYDIALDDGPALKIEVPRSAESPQHNEGDRVSLAFKVGNRPTVFADNRETDMEAPK